MNGFGQEILTCVRRSLVPIQRIQHCLARVGASGGLESESAVKWTVCAGTVLVPVMHSVTAVEWVSEVLEQSYSLWAVGWGLGAASRRHVALNIKTCGGDIFAVQRMTSGT